MRITKSKEERYEELVDLAARLFLAQGYEATSVSDIVREAKVAQGTFYYHFQSKDDVLVAVVKKTVAELEERVRAVTGWAGAESEPSRGTRRVSPEQRLSDVLDTVGEFAREHSALIAHVHLNSNALLHHRVMGTTTTMLRKYLVPLVREGRRDGSFAVEYPEETVDFLLGGMAGMLHMPGVGERRAETNNVKTAIRTMLARCLGIKQRRGATRKRR